MPGYYTEKLSARRLQRAYEIAPPRVRQYLEVEIAFVLAHTRPGGYALDLGCGYGRVLDRILDRAGTVTGVDTSFANLEMAREFVQNQKRCPLVLMDAARLGFLDRTFDTVICIQNGISAFMTDPDRLVGEALRVAKEGGTILFSSYAERFWEDRLEWFRLQADAGLLGEIDEAASRNGVIVCKDGFKATTYGPEDFKTLCAVQGVTPEIAEVDGSSLFCIIRS